MGTSPVASNPFDQFDQTQTNPFDQFDANASADPAQAAPQPSGFQKFANLQREGGIIPALQTVAHFGTAMLGGLGGGLNYLGTLAATGGDTQAAASVMQDTQNALTYNPSSPTAQADIAPVNALLSLPSVAGNKLGDLAYRATGSPAVGSFANTATQALPILLGARLSKGTTLAESAGSEVTPEVALAKQNGYFLTPQQGGGTLGKWLQGLANSAKTERLISEKNAPVVNNAVRTDLGMGPGPSISEVDFSKAIQGPMDIRNQLKAAGTFQTDPLYQASLDKIAAGPGSGAFQFKASQPIQDLVANHKGIGQFDAADAVEQVAQLRKEGNGLKYGPYDPAKQAEGNAKLAVASAIEDQIERGLQSTNNPELLQQWKAARVQLAKINDVQNSMIGENVSPQDIFKLGEGNNKLTGNLKTVATMRQNFDRSFQDLSKIRNNGPFDAFDVDRAMFAPKNPELWGSIFGRPLMRQFLASKLYQNYGIGRASAPWQIPGTLAGPAAGTLATGYSQ